MGPRDECGKQVCLDLACTHTRTCPKDPEPCFANTLLELFPIEAMNLTSSGFTMNDCYQACQDEYRCRGFELSQKTGTCNLYLTRHSKDPFIDFQILPLGGDGAEVDYQCYAKPLEHAMCSQNPVCAAKGLAGPFCCPTKVGIRLQCCDPMPPMAVGFVVYVIVATLAVTLCITCVCCCKAMRSSRPISDEPELNNLSQRACCGYFEQGPLSDQDLNGKFLVFLGNTNSGSGDVNTLFKELADKVLPGRVNRDAGAGGLAMTANLGNAEEKLRAFENIKTMLDKRAAWDDPNAADRPEQAPPEVRVFACGGDGTVTWVLKELYEDKLFDLYKAAARQETFFQFEDDDGSWQEITDPQAISVYSHVTEANPEGYYNIAKHEYTITFVSDDQYWQTNSKTGTQREVRKITPLAKDLAKAPPVGIIPLGTGNDLARSLGWGSALLDKRELRSYILRMVSANAKVVKLDQWKLSVYPQKMFGPALTLDDERHDRECEYPVALKHNGLFQNYFSVGLDGRVTYGVAQTRGHGCGKCCFASRCPGCPKLHGGLLCYAIHAPIPRLPCCRSEPAKIEVSYKDGPQGDWTLMQETEFRELKGQQFTLTNLNSYGAGMQIFAEDKYHPHPKTRDNYVADPQDELLEAFTVTSERQLASMTIFRKLMNCLLFWRCRNAGTRPIVKQARSFKIKVDESQWFQMDGEGIMIDGKSEVHITHRRQVAMILPPNAEKDADGHVNKDAGIWHSMKYDFWEQQRPPPAAGAGPAAFQVAPA
eukprot:TRINITY_DN18718_c0_g2_i1.p1 TRINITY_DN18718_c0_g2~~TRINITY_DN18718_c0_g2_i1.p1  ORF type:complete len:888 (+),score=130.26 TRINITY_DN18718_c0_g2_i1:371-2665(+)